MLLVLTRRSREPSARCWQHLCAWRRRYGYGYSCLEGEPGAASLANPTSPFCVIKQVPFRGVDCSDAAGGEMAYVSLMRLVDGGNTTSGVQWDESTGSNCTMDRCLLSQIRAVFVLADTIEFRVQGSITLTTKTARCIVSAAAVGLS